MPGQHIDERDRHYNFPTWHATFVLPALRSTDPAAVPCAGRHGAPTLPASDSPTITLIIASECIRWVAIHAVIADLPRRDPLADHRVTDAFLEVTEIPPSI